MTPAVENNILYIWNVGHCREQSKTIDPSLYVATNLSYPTLSSLPTEVYVYDGSQMPVLRFLNAGT